MNKRSFLLSLCSPSFLPSKYPAVFARFNDAGERVSRLAAFGVASIEQFSVQRPVRVRLQLFAFSANITTSFGFVSIAGVRGGGFGGFVRFGGLVRPHRAFGFAGFASAEGASRGAVVVAVVVVVARALAIVFFDDFELPSRPIGSVFRAIVVGIAKLVSSVLRGFRALRE